MKPFWQDKPFWQACLAGPICWAVLLAVLPRVPFEHNVLAVLQLIVLMPVLEELVFRGGLQSWLLTYPVFQKRVLFFSLANILSSVVFALFHLFNQPPLWAALVFLPSLVFGWALERYKSVVPCIALHALYNAGFVLLFVNTLGV